MPLPSVGMSGKLRRRNNNKKLKLDYGAKMPTRAHEADAGLDLYSRDSAMIWAGKSEVFDTGFI